MGFLIHTVLRIGLRRLRLAELEFLPYLIANTLLGRKRIDSHFFYFAKFLYWPLIISKIRRFEQTVLRQSWEYTTVQQSLKRLSSCWKNQNILVRVDSPVFLRSGGSDGPTKKVYVDHNQTLTLNPRDHPILTNQITNWSKSGFPSVQGTQAAHRWKWRKDGASDCSRRVCTPPFWAHTAAQPKALIRSVCYGSIHYLIFKLIKLNFQSS